MSVHNTTYIIQQRISLLNLFTISIQRSSASIELEHKSALTEIYIITDKCPHLFSSG